MTINAETGLPGGGAICPRGAYCPVGTPAPQPCRNGTYNNLLGQSACTTCPAGYYCTFGVADYTSGVYDCPKGYYCPQGTLSPTQYACPPGACKRMRHSSICVCQALLPPPASPPLCAPTAAGTYNPLTKRHALSDCLTAPPGTYAQGYGNSGTRNCTQGFYCPGLTGATTGTPACAGAFCGSGGRCVPGQVRGGSKTMPSICRA